MARGSRTAQYINRASDGHQDQTAWAVLSIAGAMFSLLGAGLVLVGSLSPSASLFYVFAGFGLILSGMLLARRNIVGAWTYMIVFVATFFWSLTNLGAGGSSLAYRLVGPGVLLVMIALLTPFFGRRTRRQAAATCTALIIATVAVGLLSSTSNERSGRPGAAAGHFRDTSMNGAAQ